MQRRWCLHARGIAGKNDGCMAGPSAFCDRKRRAFISHRRFPDIPHVRCSIAPHPSSTSPCITAARLLTTPSPNHCLYSSTVPSPATHDTSQRRDVTPPIPHRHTTHSWYTAIATLVVSSAHSPTPISSYEYPHVQRHGTERQRCAPAGACPPLQGCRARRMARTGQDVQVPARGRHEAVM